MNTSMVTVTGLVTCAAGLLILKVAGVDMPPVPPALILLLVAAALMVATRWRWTPGFAALIALAEAAAFLAGGPVAELTDPSPFGVFAGTWIRGIGATVALIAGVATTIGNYRTPKPETARR